MTVIESMGKKAKEVARVLATAGALKDKALLSIADALIENTDYILEENAKDLEAGKEAGLTNALLDRLALSPERIKGMAEGARQVEALPDPCGRVISGGKLKNGLEVTKVTVPLGVIGIIYEARPNVTAD